IGVAANEAIALRGWVLAGENGFVARKRSKSGFKSNAARAGAAFEESGHIDAPGIRGLRALGGSELNARKFFGFVEVAAEASGADGGASAERGRRAGRWRLRRLLRFCTQRSGGAKKAERSLGKELPARIWHESSKGKHCNRESKNGAKPQMAEKAAALQNHE